MSNKFLFLPALLFLCGISIANAGDFKWLPVTRADWDIKVDSSKGYKDAVVLFEHLIGDDENLNDERCKLYVYDRIRILSPAGRKYGDIEIPFDDDIEDVRDITARAILPGGQEFQLAKDQIHEGTLVQGENVQLKKKSFSIPGLTDDCIVEYSYLIRTKRPDPEWIIQREIPVLHAEYRWKYFKSDRQMGLTMSGIYLQEYIISHLLTPNFQWLNTESKGRNELLPSASDPDTARFYIDDVPAIAIEPAMQNPNALKTKLLMFYGGKEPVTEYWSELIGRFYTIREAFCKEDDKLNPKLAEWALLPTQPEKIQAAYDWVQSTFTNSNSSRDKIEGKKASTNTSINDLVEHGTGNPNQINMMFWDILTKLHIDSWFAYTVDRNRHNFVMGAKYNQFEGTLVAIPVGEHDYHFYGPGYQGLAPLYQPIFAQGTMCLILRNDNRGIFEMVPFEIADSNRVQTTFHLSLTQDDQLAGTIEQTYFGLSARDLRLDFNGKTSPEQTLFMQHELEGQIESSELDSIRLETGTSTTGPVHVYGKIRFNALVEKAGNRMLLHPSSNLAKTSYSFIASERQHPILFDYAYEHAGEVQIRVPQGFVIEGLPADTVLRSNVGLYTRLYADKDSLVSFKTTTRLEVPSVKQSAYSTVRDFFGVQQAADQGTVIFKPKEEPKLVIPIAPAQPAKKSAAKRKK